MFLADVLVQFFCRTAPVTELFMYDFIDKMRSLGYKFEDSPMINALVERRMRYSTAFNSLTVIASNSVILPVSFGNS